MPSLFNPSVKVTPEIIPVGYNLYIRKRKRGTKFGLRDHSQRVDLLLMIYDRIELIPGTTYLKVQQDELVGIYDIMLRMWLVPLKFSSIYPTKTPMQFIVFLDKRKGLYDGVTNRLTWF